MLKRMIKRGLGYFLRPIYEKSQALNQDSLCLLLSPWFDPVWYQKTYALHPQLTWCQLAEHYLTQGAVAKLDPSAEFSTTWYWNHYPDVHLAQMNPLLHYLRYGHQEGRFASKQAWLDGEYYQSISDALWGGLSRSAFEQLTQWQSSADPGERFITYYQQARWAYSHHDWAQYYACAQKLSLFAQDKPQQKIAWLLGAFALYYHSQDKAAMGNYLRPLRDLWQQDIDFQLAWANAQGDDQQRLKALNQMYLSRGFAPLATLAEPLCLATLTSQAPAIDDGPLVSVIIPLYNAQQTIDAALRGLTEQSWRRLEIIVVDDASSDQSLAKVQGWCSRDQRIKLHRQPSNQGAYAARNAGLLIATGDFITTHDADDWSHPQKIATQVQALMAEPQLMATCCAWVRVQNDVFITQNWRPSGQLAHYSHSSLLVRREVVSTLQGWQPLRCAADTDFIRRLEAHYGKSALTVVEPDVPLAFALDDGGSLTRQSEIHVRTVYFGVRHIYHQIRQLQRFLDKQQPGAFALPIPQQLFPHRPAVASLDLLIVADFTQPSAMANDWLKRVQQAVANQQSVGLFHWPSLRTCGRHFSLDYAYALAEQRVVPIVGGQSLDCDQIWVADKDLLSCPVDSEPQLINFPEGIAEKVRDNQPDQCLV
ncbi:glycosyltransferase family 2 protein [Vibrio metschnikovii]|nr:glycosyltransferase family 2 protein [Vibrio metschnikovii]EKO3586347.1 glycosyltransferase family 2 protein [Vibrio metschnikovii]ELF5343537.1 glycosyltransferase family 2 protein [Vibrio metschnikovii]